MSDIKVGSTIWRFDDNHRVYDRGPDGRAIGGAIYREHWVPVVIRSETSRSWIVPYGKCPKKGDHHGFAFSAAEVDDDCWVHSNGGRLSNAVLRCKDASKLRAIADILGWEERRAT
jgi:hypothetical protein